MAVVVPSGEWKQGWLGGALNTPLWALQSSVSWLAGTSKKSRDSPYLKDGFAAVSAEVAAENLEVVGKIPDDLSGCFLRTGPNPRWTPVGGYHWFDGDGMVPPTFMPLYLFGKQYNWEVVPLVLAPTCCLCCLMVRGQVHACRIKDGKVHYSNRWVRTNRFTQEEAAGWASWTKLGDLVGVSGLVSLAVSGLKSSLGVTTNAEQGAGTANTALVYHANRLLALHEGDMPYALRVLCEGVVETAGRMAYTGQKSFTAHPKIDPKTGTLHFFGYSLDKAPYLTYSAADSTGKQIKSIPITVPKPTMMHDFAITENHVIFIDTPVVFDPSIMVKKGRMPFVFDDDHGIRFGVRSHDAPDDEEAVKWFTLPSCMIFHVANAWEEGSQIHLHACVMPYLDLGILSGDAPEEDRDNMPTLHHFVFNLKTGKATSTKMSTVLGDFPQIDQRLCGQPCRYVYAAVIQADDATESMKKEGAKFKGIAKFDLHKNGCEAGDDAKVGSISLGESRGGGESIFVPRAKQTSEDDGYLITYVTNEAVQTTSMVVYDAKTMDPSPLAEVKLPQRVPYGFHGLFISEEDLQKQQS